MGELVDQHNVVRPDQGRDDARIGEVAGAKDACRFGAFQASQAMLERLEQRIVTGHETGGPGASPVAGDGLYRGRFHGRVVAQIEVVIAGKREQAAPIAHGPDSVKSLGRDEGTPQVYALKLAKFALRKVIQ